MFFDIFLIKICIPIKLDSFAFQLSIQYSSIIEYYFLPNQKSAIVFTLVVIRFFSIYSFHYDSLIFIGSMDSKVDFEIVDHVLKPYL